ncbi:Centrosomal protein [Amphibalanus amphitrite]|uniref:Centrosomal protein n=1 Tax=Amphibalanus amphitrite TaxID=1232801 RepID=A0A6A4VZ07_AMPAM|nr:Centrosomal protein [Amphibalanus amphitrite]KAF0296600.1 Centrosomal protein [Amphibalanus amphitrite]
MSSRASVGQKSSQVICEEIFDEDSIATHDEVLEYARRIGIDPEREPHLLHIADEGVNQSLPPGWKPCFEEEKGLLYYFNFRSGETRWEHPLDAVYRQKVIVARKQAASAEGGVPTGAGAEFGRSRRLCAEEEREKKNVSFAPSVHQIEFDLDEEEEDEDCEDVHDDRLRQLQTPQPPPLHGASWLREKLEDSGRPGGDRLSLLRAPPDRDDSLEMAQDITEDSQLSLHASEGSDSPRRQLERRKEEEVRAALRERRLAEQRRREPSPPPAPAPQPAAVGPAPLTPARLRPLAPCGLGGGGSGVRPTVTVSAPVLGGDGQQPTSPARLAVRQMRHRIRALGMWSDGDGASSDGDRAPPESGGPADVRRILDRAKHFLHGQTAAASRYRRASEPQSDSEDVSTDDEERSATERDVQLRAVTRHYGRLKQERSHASDSQLNVRPSSAYQPSRGEQLHSSLAAIHTVLERTQELKAWLRKATVAWKLGSLDV